MKKQSIKDLVFRVFNISADGGYAEDDVVDCTPRGDAVVVIEGADGSATASYLTQRVWDVKFRCMENSDFHRRLMGVYEQQQAGVQVSGTGMFRRSTAGETLQSSNIVITKPPVVAAGKSPKVREWSFAFCDSTYSNVAPTA